MSDEMPSEREALTILRQSGCPPDVIKHCKAVAKLAVNMAKRCSRKENNVDIELVTIGALLHDIGRSKTHDLDHAIVGAAIARSLGLPDQVVLIIERHIGGGITPEEAEKMGLPNRSYLPQTLEEKIVAYADKLIEGSKKIPIDRTIEIFKRKLGSRHPAVDRLRKLHEEMSVLLRDPGW